MKKRLLAIIATVAMVVAMMPSMVFGADATELPPADSNGVISLTEDVTLAAPFVVGSDEDITIDLNGHTISYNNTIQGEAMIKNMGKLTINDSAGGGVINYNYTGEADESHGIGNYTISNSGTLTVNGGKITIANLRAHAKYPIDNNSTTGDAVLIINGGHLYNYNTSAIRQFCNSTTYKNSVTINGGVIEGYCAIWVQNPGGKTVNGDLTITGGEIKSTAAAYVNGTSELKDVKSRIYFTIDGEGGAWSENSFVEITGGTFNENVNLTEETPGDIAVGKRATFNGYIKSPVYNVTITTTPDGATIVVKDADGNEVAAEDGTYKLINGTYTYVVSKDGYDEESSEFVVEGQDKYIAITLSETALGGEDEVDTGDNMNVVIPFAIAALALAAMGTVVATRRRHN